MRRDLIAYSIVIVAILACAIHARGETNSLPPLPGGATISMEDVMLAHQAEEDEAYEASLWPSPRVLMEDGRIIKWSKESIEWHITAPYYRVQWRASLTDGEWKTIGYRTGDKLTHGKPEGFYRVTPCKRPTLPPTYPPKRHPDATAARASTNRTSKTWQGFRTVDK